MTNMYRLGREATAVGIVHKAPELRNFIFIGFRRHAIYRDREDMEIILDGIHTTFKYRTTDLVNRPEGRYDGKLHSESYRDFVRTLRGIDPDISGTGIWEDQILTSPPNRECIEESVRKILTERAKYLGIPVSELRIINSRFRNVVSELNVARDRVCEGVGKGGEGPLETMYKLPRAEESLTISKYTLLKNVALAINNSQQRNQTWVGMRVSRALVDDLMEYLESRGYGVEIDDEGEDMVDIEFHWSALD